MPFKSKLKTEAGYEGKKVKDTLLAPLVYKSDSLKRIIVVPEGFKTDYASLPWLSLIHI